MNINEDIKTEVNDEDDEDGDEISDEDMKVEVDIDFNYVRHEIIKKEPVGDNEDISVAKKEIIDDDVNIKTTPSDDGDVDDKLQLVKRLENREINSPMRFLHQLEELTRCHKDTDQLIAFQSKSSRQKNIAEAKRTGTDRLRICATCNKSLRSIKTSNNADYTHVIKLNYKPPQRTNSDYTDSCHMCNRVYPGNTQQLYFKCTFCHFETNNKHTLNTHTNARHTKRIRYTCVFCSFKTYVKVKLGSHVNVAHAESLTCPYCGYAAKFKSYLNRHVCAQHASSKEFSCNFCTYSSKQKIALDNHFVDAHTETCHS